MLTCSLPPLSCHDPVSEPTPQSGIAPKECWIAITVFENGKIKLENQSQSCLVELLFPCMLVILIHCEHYSMFTGTRFSISTGLKET